MPVTPAVGRWQLKDPEVQDRPQLLSSFMASPGHIGLCLLTAKNKQCRALSLNVQSPQQAFQLEGELV